MHTYIYIYIYIYLRWAMFPRASAVRASLAGQPM